MIIMITRRIITGWVTINTEGPERIVVYQVVKR